MKYIVYTKDDNSFEAEGPISHLNEVMYFEDGVAVNKDMFAYAVPVKEKCETLVTTNGLDKSTIEITNKAVRLKVESNE